MGNRMMCVTTPKTEVMRGDASSLENRCVTTTTPKGGWGGGDGASPVQREVVRTLVQMPLIISGGVAWRGYAFALCQPSRLSASLSNAPLSSGDALSLE